MSLKTAVVGLGAMGRHHARILSELPDVDLVAACDLDEARAREHAELRGATPLTDPADLPEDLDAVVVSTPTSFHREVAEPLLRRGVACMVEKPLAGSIEDGEAMIEAGRSGSAVLFTGHAERFNPGLMRVRELLDRPVFIECHRLGVFPERSLDIDVVLDLMIHDLDLLRALTGAELERVEAIGVNVLTPKVDIANARLSFSNGCTANVTASRVSAEITRKLRAFSEQRYVSVDFVAQSAEVFELGPGEGRPVIRRETYGPAEGEPKQEPLRHELVAFLAAVRGEEEPRVSGEDGLAALKAALRVVEAMASQRTQRERLRGGG
jgi:predicted dehydrogenase